MTVGELIEELNQFDKNLEIKHYTGDVGDAEIKYACLDDYGYVCIY